MSYEGYIRRLCTQGHYYSIDAYEEFPATCPHCDSAWAWEQSIDQTNGPYDEKAGVRCDGDFELELRARAEVCKHCGHETTPEKFWIPTCCGRRLAGHPYGEEESEK